MSQTGRGVKIVADGEGVKKEFQRQWTGVFTSKGPRDENQDTPWLEGIKGQNYDRVLDLEISPREIREVIQKLKLKKAPGTDKISNDMLKNMSIYQIDVLSTIIEAVRKSRKIPHSWKDSLTVLIFKGKGNKSDPAGDTAQLHFYHVSTRYIQPSLTADLSNGWKNTRSAQITSTASGKGQTLQTQQLNYLPA